MPDYETLARQMDDTVDTVLGDVISVSISGGAFVPYKGFVLIDHAVAGIDALDILAQRVRIKISKEIVEDPATARFQAAKLGPGTFRNCGDVEETAGRYWLLDVQRI